jgi:hypothetical protein
VATPGLVEGEPSTVIAFLAAYIRALRDLGDPAMQPEAFGLIESSALLADSGASDWPGGVASYAPFDGGFGSLEDEGGLGELGLWLSDPEDEVPDLDSIIARHTLTIAQLWLGLEPNPDSPLAGSPARTQISVGLGADDGTSPVSVALQAGYFEAAGFESVELVEVEEPILGVLTGELDFGILDALQAADGTAQGLPLRALAGHRNDDVGSPGRNLLVASADLVEGDASTAASFLMAYIRGLRDLTGSGDGAYAPFDGGFGSLEDEGGLGQLRTSIAGVLGEDADLEALVAREPLEYAQAWWGLPANPVRLFPPEGPEPDGSPAPDATTAPAATMEVTE